MNGRWLNIILDLNGILCVCKERRYLPKEQLYNDLSQPHSAVLPAVVGPKAVYVRPHCQPFLRELALIAYISVWSSMANSTTRLICEYLFHGLEPPLHIFGQEFCEVIKCRGVRGKITNFKVKGTNKDLFLKPLDKLFDLTNSKFSSINTVIVDDSPEKHVLNEPENVVLPQSWSEGNDGASDRFLVDDLMPWIQRLHNSKGQGLLTFRRNDNIGRRMLIEEADTSEYDEVVNAIDSSKIIANELPSRR